ncbi:MAG: hypothetical protein U0531_07145 [Dehalococcoidia bacterium]
MPVPAANAATPITTTTLAAATPAQTKPGQQVDYMKLIVAQMRNLNPMDPSSGGDSLPIMMQAESLNQLTLLNQALAQLQATARTGYATSLIGRTISGVDSNGKVVSGSVRAAHWDSAGPVLQLTGGDQVRLLDVTSVAAD